MISLYREAKRRAVAKIKADPEAQQQLVSRLSYEASTSTERLLRSQAASLLKLRDKRYRG